MSIFIVIIISLVVGAFVGGYVFFLLLITTFNNDPKMVIDLLCKSVGVNAIVTTNLSELNNVLSSDVDNKLDQRVVNAIELSVKKYGEQFYLYFKESESYISQGSSIDEAMERAHKRYPGQYFIYTLDD